MEPMNVEQLDRAVNEMDSILITGIFQVPTSMEYLSLSWNEAYYLGV